MFVGNFYITLLSMLWYIEFTKFTEQVLADLPKPHQQNHLWVIESQLPTIQIPGAHNEIQKGRGRSGKRSRK